MKLVDDWKDVWKWHSTHFMILLGAVPTVWMQIPDDAKAMIPSGVQPWVPAALLVAGLFGRIRAQP